jgi:uncharacterized protein (TIGR02147 family)
MANTTTFRQVLRDELDKRLFCNPRYSLRAFARDLELTPSRLSELISGKQGMSRRAAMQVGRRLGFVRSQLLWFCDLVDSEHARSQARRDAARERVQRHTPVPGDVLGLDEFRCIADWHHLAILEMAKLAAWRPDPAWIGAQLGIPPAEAEAAVTRLVGLGLLEPTGDAGVNLRVSAPAPSAAIRAFHRQIVAKAADAIDAVPMERRILGATVIAVDRRRLPELATRLRALRQEFEAEASQHDERDAVYCFSTQLFPLTEDRP